MKVETDWQRLDELVQAALAKDADDRSTFLAEAVDGDTQLLAEAESLLKAHQHAGRFLETPALKAFAAWCQGPGGSRVGQSLGPYEILQVLGSGGMGMVFLARRADDEYQKRVAIKLVNPAIGSEELLQRFRAERQILASLEHPNIAQLYDGGTTEEALPYLVMEYIEGLPIDVWCDHHQLSIGERLELFLTICRAVQYAHQKLVVHRDLKPKNILVAHNGVPKLLDFGIAKLLDAEGARDGADLTRTGQRPMTPNYASPEQLRQQAVTTASDVYSLGVLLYLLVTGRLPRQLDRLEHPDLEHTLREEPTTPSRAVVAPPPDADGDALTALAACRRSSPRQLRRRLAGDLDNIILKALREEPRRRYASVEQFAEDLRRHRDGLPVKARPATLGYRAGKFLRRNRVAAVVAAAFLALVLGFSVHTVGQNREISRERDRAQEESQRAQLESDKAQQVAAFLVELIEGSDPREVGRTDLTVREVLDQGAARLPGRLGQQPEVRALLLDTMGSIYANLDLFERSEEFLKQALDLRREIHGDEHPEVAASLTHLGQVLITRGRYDEAEGMLRQAWDIRRRSAAPEGPELAQNLAALAEVLFFKGGYDEAESLGRRSVDFGRRFYSGSHPRLIESLNQLAQVLVEQGDLVGADALYLEALGGLRREGDPESLQLADTLNHLAGLRFLEGDLQSAAEMAQESLDIRRAVLGPEHTSVGEIMNLLAAVLFTRGDHGAAEALQREVLRLAHKNLGEQHRATAVSMSNLARMLLERGALEESEGLYRGALEIVRRVLPGGHPGAAYPLLDLGKTLIARGKPREAESVMREALELRRGALPSEHHLIATSENILGGCLVALGRYREAEALLVPSHATLQAMFGAEHRQSEASLKRLVELYEAWGKKSEAAEYRSQLASSPEK